MKRNRGAVALARTGLTQSTIADACTKRDAPVSQQAVNLWLAEKRKPDADSRAALHDAYGIEPAWWNEVEVDPPPSLDTLERYQRCAERMWALFDSDPLGPDCAAQGWAERVEVLLDRGLLASAVSTSRAVPTMQELEERVRRQAEKQITLLETDTAALPLERVRLLEKLWNIVKPSSNEAKLVKSKQWVTVREKLIAVVMKFPDAREAILQALESAEVD